MENCVSPKWIIEEFHAIERFHIGAELGIAAEWPDGSREALMIPMPSPQWREGLIEDCKEHLRRLHG